MSNYIQFATVFTSGRRAGETLFSSAVDLFWWLPGVDHHAHQASRSIKRELLFLPFSPDFSHPMLLIRRAYAWNS
jgi:hypothetical protein